MKQFYLYNEETFREGMKEQRIELTTTLFKVVHSEFYEPGTEFKYENGMLRDLKHHDMMCLLGLIAIPFNEYDELLEEMERINALEAYDDKELLDELLRRGYQTSLEEEPEEVLKTPMLAPIKFEVELSEVPQDTLEEVTDDATE